MEVLTYSFYPFKSTDTNFTSQYYLASMKRAKKLGYKIKLYSTYKMYETLKQYTDEFVSIDLEKFLLTDDLKIYIHSKEDINCVTIDGDVILKKALHFDNSADIIFDRRGRIHNRKSNSIFAEYFSALQPYFPEKELKYFDYEGTFSSNVGILKFNNQELKDLLIEEYNSAKNFFYSKIFPNLYQEVDLAKILCEYYFTRIIEKKQFKASYLSEQEAYIHYHSNTKLTPEFKREIQTILLEQNDKVL